MGTTGQEVSQFDVGYAMQLAERFLDVWNQHDIQALMEMFHPQATLTTPPVSGPLSGEAVREYLEANHAAFPDEQAESVGPMLLGPGVIGGRFYVTGTWTKPMTAGPLAGMTPTGKHFTLESADFLEIRDGKIIAWTQYYDRLGLLAQLGIITQK